MSLNLKQFGLICLLSLGLSSAQNWDQSFQIFERAADDYETEPPPEESRGPKAMPGSRRSPQISFYEEPRSISAKPYDWSKYYTLEETNTFLKNLSSSFPGIAAYSSIGETAYNRNISVFIIELENIQNRGPRPVIFIEAGIYGNEWIGPAAATYIINTLLTTEDEDIQEFAKSYFWYIVPFSNPDGYEYSFSKDPLWRKNRKQYASLCYGVDLNRNFDVHWSEDMSSRDPCSNVYAGPKAESEKETQALANFIASLPALDVFISLQGYSQQLLYPLGYSNSTPSNEASLRKVATAAIDALENRYGTKYTAGNMFSAMHPVAGSDMDWAFSRGIPMSFTYKLRPSIDSPDKTTRKVPNNQILPTVLETFDSLVAMINEIGSQGYFQFHHEYNKFPLSDN